jgi:HNH endonuclease
MCRGKRVCAVLGDRPELWSKRAPLQVPAWFSAELESFRLAVDAASSGDRGKVGPLLATVNSTGLREWFVEHGQVSGRFRVKAQPSSYAALLASSGRDSHRAPDLFAKQVLRRDGYLCRYCGQRVVPKEVLAAFSAVVGKEAFRATGTNAERHGVVLAFRANVDHVVPWRLGGPTDLYNLVTACWSCNYGKAGFTIEQLGLDDPRERAPAAAAAAGWDGLLPYLTGLRAHAA